MTIEWFLNQARKHGTEFYRMRKSGNYAGLADKFNEWAEAQKMVLHLICFLSDSRERTVLLNYYCNVKPLSEVASNIDISRVQADRIRKKAIQELEKVVELE